MKNKITTKTVPTLSMTYTKLLNEWLALNQPNHKDSTRANYRMKHEKHIAPVFGNKKITDISFLDIQSFISEKIGDDLSVNYVVDMIVLMKSVFRYSSKCYGIENPFGKVIIPKKHKKEKELLSKEERIRLERYLYGHLK